MICLKHQNLTRIQLELKNSFFFSVLKVIFVVCCLANTCSLKILFQKCLKVIFVLGNVDFAYGFFGKT